MASDLSYVEHVCDQLRGVSGLAHRKMFGEYALYAQGKVVALICDNQLFVKPTGAGRALLGDPAEGRPFPGAKLYFMLDEHIDNRDLLTEVILATAAELPAAKPKRKRG